MNSEQRIYPPAGRYPYSSRNCFLAGPTHRGCPPTPSQQQRQHEQRTAAVVATATVTSAVTAVAAHRKQPAPMTKATQGAPFDAFMRQSLRHCAQNRIYYAAQ
eukprot:GHVU01107697.1.p1 GENE.GHVU01107697.1~~GHVU01107697.1.p1  ORF type:complete len:103 (+),score=7.30 GHVU01107697.1:859-1167(+)